MNSFLNSVPLNTSGNLSVFSSVVFLGEVTPGIMVSGPDLGSSLNMLWDSPPHSNFLRSNFALLQHPLLIPSLLAGPWQRNFRILCVWKLPHGQLPSSLEGSALLPAVMVGGRRWAHPVFHPRSASLLDVFTLFWNFTVLCLGGLGFFFLSHQLSLTHANSCSSVLWHFLNYFFEKYLAPSFIFSIPGPPLHYLDLSFVVYSVPPPHFLSPFFVLIVLVCFETTLYFLILLLNLFLLSYG